MSNQDCTCDHYPHNHQHYPACPASLYQAGIQRGAALARAVIEAARMYRKSVQFGTEKLPQCMPTHSVIFYGNQLDDAIAAFNNAEAAEREGKKNHETRERK